MSEYDWKSVAGSVIITGSEETFVELHTKIDRMQEAILTRLTPDLFADYAMGRPMTRRERVAEWWFFSRVRRYLRTLWDALRGRIDYYDYE